MNYSKRLKHFLPEQLIEGESSSPAISMIRRSSDDERESVVGVWGERERRE